MILFQKAVDDELQAVERLLDGVERRYRKIIADWLETVKSEETISAVLEALERGQVERAIEIINSGSKQFSAPIYEIMIGAAIFESRNLDSKIVAYLIENKLPASVGVSFDPGNPRASQLLKETAETFIVELDQSTRQTVYATLAEMQLAGASPTQMARAIQGNLGLTTRQLEAVNNYRRLLEEGSLEALDRQQRDRRFDPSVRRAKERPLSPEQIDRMVERYKQTAIKNRAITIARTESLSAVNAARFEAFRQSLEATGIDPTRAVKEWRSSRDNRVRDQHVSLDGQRTMIDQPFIAPNGDRLLVPGDRTLGARPANIVNCRCNALYFIE